MGMVYFPADGFDRMQEMMTRQLGQPAKPDNTPSKLIWDGADVSVLLSLGDKTDLRAWSTCINRFNSKSN